jgi:hypothetical protein
VATHFRDSNGESTTSHKSSTKGGNSATNGSDLDKNNIIKPTFDTLMEEGRKTFKTYHADLEELFLSYCEVTQQGTVLKDTTPTIIRKAEVAPEVRLNPSPPLNDVQSMINPALERQAKSTDELLRRLIEEWDVKKLDNSSVNPSSSSCAVSFAQTNSQISGTSVGSTTMPNPSAQSMNHFHNRTTIEGLAPTFGMPQQTIIACSGKGICKPHLVFLCQILALPHTHPWAMAKRTQMLAATTKSHTPP